MAKTKKGFTIIEVVLVLAIAGLIFLMVFIALPALQRSQRNTQREDDISRFLTAGNSYQSNNNGKIPYKVATGGASITVDKNFVHRYIDESCPANTTPEGITCDGDEFRDPDGNNYQLVSGGVGNGSLSASFNDNAHKVHAFAKATCGDEGEAKVASGERFYALMYVLEGNAITCNDNH